MISQQARGRAAIGDDGSFLPDRRQSDRYATTEDQAWLGWWEGRVYRRSPATLLDISQGGAHAIAEVPPPRRSTIWICLDGPHRTEWIEAEVVEVTRLADATARVRLAFREVCPYNFFEVAIHGAPGSQAPVSARSVGLAACHRVGW